MTTINVNHETICINPTDDLTLYDKNHIMSRIEKFLFAICSLDSSDLPFPLSRIEELYNCLVTGDTPPTFEPLSRAEKFLMACLGIYDVNNLPNPLSRSEVLLKKLATGDSNLDDVDNLKSKYEFLLAYIIQNGGIDSDISFDEVDYEYLRYTFASDKYTLEGTAEQPVKSAVLKGQSLVNLQPNSVFISGAEATSSTGVAWMEEAIIGPVTVGETYFVRLYNLPAKVSRCYLGGVIIDIVNGEYAIITTTDSQDRLHVYGTDFDDTTFNNCRVLICEYQEGMENWDIPYFEGMGSVKNPTVTTTGKNLFNSPIKINSDISFTTGLETSTGGRAISTDYIPVKPNTTYTLTRPEAILNIGLRLYDSNFRYDNSVTHISSEDHIVFNTGNNWFLKFIDEANKMTTMYQLEEGSVATEYEPYKSSTVTVNEGVELQGIGDVIDELDMMTGELKRFVGIYAIDGSQGLSLTTIKDKTIVYKMGLTDVSDFAGIIFSPTHKVASGIDEEIITFLVDGAGYITIFFALSNTKATDAASAVEYLKTNPLVFYYKRKTPVISHVNTTAKDQDGNDIPKLKTFEDITHVTITSEELIPESEIEVAKYIPYMSYTLTENEATLYNTAEKPIKSAILKGQTLVNTNRPITRNDNMKVENGWQILTTWTTAYNLWMVNDITLFKTNTKYYIIVEVINNTLNTTWSPMIGSIDCVFSGNIPSLNFASGETGIKCATFTTKSDFTNVICGLRSATGTNETVGSILKFKIAIIEYQEGMENWDIPYFEGIGSVKNPTVTTTDEYRNKSNTVTCNDEVELRGIGDVKDELDLVTGEVTRRIGEVVLDGSEDWGLMYYTANNNKRYVINGVTFPYTNYQEISDSFSTGKSFWTVDETGMYIGGNGQLVVVFKTTDDRYNYTIEEFKEYLSENPVKLQCIIEESIESTNLTIEDQDGENIPKLKTFEDITYVEVSSEGPAEPEVTIEYATKTFEDVESIASFGLRMNDISAVQSNLQETSDTQSENIDVAMVASTEIFEELL